MLNERKKIRKTTQALKYYVLWYCDYLVMYRCTNIILNVNCYVQCKCVLYYSFLWYKAPCSGNCIAISKLFCFEFFFLVFWYTIYYVFMLFIFTEEKQAFCNFYTFILLIIRLYHCCWNFYVQLHCLTWCDIAVWQKGVKSVSDTIIKS